MLSMRKPDRTPGWLLNEAENAGRENLDGDHVSRYDARAGLTGASVVVEIGAGLGSLLSPSRPFALATAVAECAISRNR